MDESEIQQLRQDGEFHLQMLSLDRDTVFVDTETTDLEGHVIEIAVIDRGGDALLNTLVQSEIYDAEDTAAEVHGITNETLADAPSWDDVWPMLEEALAGSTVVIYNAQFDVPRLQTTLQDHGYGDAWHALQDAVSIECAMEPAAAHMGDWSDYHQDFRWMKLEAAALARGIRIEEVPDDLGEQHRAAFDAELTRRLVRSYEPSHDPFA